MFSKLRIAASLFAMGFAALAHADQTLNLSVQIRPNVTATIEAQVLVNPNNPTGGRTVLFQHGLAHTGNTGKNLATKLFSTPATSAKISQIVLIDQPGHGNSTLPTGLLFGNLGQNDYANVLIESLDALQANGINVDALVGHSMGGLIINLAQNILVSQSTSLFTRFGITNAIFLSPSPNGNVPWISADLLVGTILAIPHIKTSTDKGTYVEVAALTWQLLFCTNLLGLPVPGTPTISTINSAPYIAIEPYVAAAELLGIPGHPRLPVTAGIFGSTYGTVTRLVTNSQDKFILPFESQANYRFLTGDTTDARFQTIPTLDSAHDMYLTNPQGLINAGVFSDL
jgi:Alpha/beta hydrolase family